MEVIPNPLTHFFESRVQLRPEYRVAPSYGSDEFDEYYQNRLNSAKANALEEISRWKLSLRSQALSALSTMHHQLLRLKDVSTEFRREDAHFGHGFGTQVLRKVLDSSHLHKAIVVSAPKISSIHAAYVQARILVEVPGIGFSVNLSLDEGKLSADVMGCAEGRVP